ncbi:hypothetical protein [Psychromonas sp. MME2]|uniref:hypothetical protein n=1 Tax=Psychromonas sp. MME2 TaxID=3231033 RepID=UPI00339C6B00
MKLWKLVSAVITLVISTGVNASLIGNEVYAQNSFSNGQILFNSSEIVTNDIEFTDTYNSFALFELDLFDTYALFRITNTFNGGLGMGEQQLVINGFDDLIIGVNAIQTKIGLFPSNNPDFSASFSEHGITFDLMGSLSFGGSE